MAAAIIKAQVRDKLLGIRECRVALHRGQDHCVSLPVEGRLDTNRQLVQVMSPRLKAVGPCCDRLICEQAVSADMHSGLRETAIAVNMDDQG